MPPIHSGTLIHQPLAMLQATITPITRTKSKWKHSIFGEYHEIIVPDSLLVTFLHVMDFIVQLVLRI